MKPVACPTWLVTKEVCQRRLYRVPGKSWQASLLTVGTLCSLVLCHPVQETTDALTLTLTLVLEPGITTVMPGAPPWPDPI